MDISKKIAQFESNYRAREKKNVGGLIVPVGNPFDVVTETVDPLWHFRAFFLSDGKRIPFRSGLLIAVRGFWDTDSKVLGVTQYTGCSEEVLREIDANLRLSDDDFEGELIDSKGSVAAIMRFYPVLEQDKKVFSPFVAYVVESK